MKRIIGILLSTAGLAFGQAFLPDCFQDLGKPIVCRTPGVGPEWCGRWITTNGGVVQASVDPTTMPQQFPTGVAVPDEQGNWQLLTAVANGEPVISLQISASPIDPQTWASLAASNRTVALTDRQLNKTELRAIKSAMATNINDAQAIITTNFPAAGGQRQTIADLRRELIDLAQEVQKLRRIVARMNRED
jgi:hypothetical protein